MGSRPMMALQTRFRAAASFGKWPQALTARRILAFTDSIVLVVQTMRRISVSNRGNGVNPSHALSQSRTTARYFLPQASVNSANRSGAASSVGAVWTGLRTRAILSQFWRAA